MNVKERVRELAKIHGLSVPTLEGKLKFSSGSISKWDKSAPGSDKLEKVADFFNVTTDYLLGKTILSHCSICNSSYDPINHESISEHLVYHDNYLKAQEKYGKILPYLEASKLRNDSIMKFRKPSA